MNAQQRGLKDGTTKPNPKAETDEPDWIERFLDWS